MSVIIITSQSPVSTVVQTTTTFVKAVVHSVSFDLINGVVNIMVSKQDAANKVVGTEVVSVKGPDAVKMLATVATPNQTLEQVCAGAAAAIVAVHYKLTNPVVS